MKKLCFTLFSFLFLISCEKNSKPNIFWIVVEDQSQYLFPFYSNEDINLPNLDKLSSESLVFQNMYATYPVCAPARSSIITGMYPNSIGTHNMRAFQYDNYFKQGKISERSKKEQVLEIPYYSSNLAESIETFPEILRKNGYYTYNRSKGDYNFKISDSIWTEYGNEVDLKLVDKPLFAVYNYNITHESRMWQRDKEKLVINPNEIDFIPPVFPDDSIVRHSLAVNYSNLFEMDKQVGELINELKKNDLYENSYIFFYSDHGGPFPRHKRAIYETGTKVPFFVKLPKGVNEKVDKNQFLSFVDFAPTVLSIANIEIPSEYQGKAFIGNFKSKTKREYLFTSSDRFDENPDRIRAVRDNKFKYIRNYFPENSHALDVEYRTQMALMRHLTSLHLQNKLSTKQNLWFRTPKLAEELYDLDNDPFELNNLSNNPDYIDKLNNLSDVLDKWLDEIDDLGRIPEKELIKIITDEN